jgi:hypothetical protein
MRSRPAALFLILILAVACASAREPEGPRIETAEDLLAALTEAGIEVDETAILAPRLDLGEGRVVFLGTQQVEVYEQTSEAEHRSALQGLLQEIPADRTPNLWARGRIIVIYDGPDGPTIAVLSGLMGDSVTLAAPAPDEPYPPAVAAAIGWLADSQSIDPGQVAVESFEASEWPDACLGLPAADEACAGVITPGWRISLRVGERTVVVRTDALGSQVRSEP